MAGRLPATSQDFIKEETEMSIVRFMKNAARSYANK